MEIPNLNAPDRQIADFLKPDGDVLFFGPIARGGPLIPHPLPRLEPTIIVEDTKR